MANQDTLYKLFKPPGGIDNDVIGSSINIGALTNQTITPQRMLTTIISTAGSISNINLPYADFTGPLYFIISGTVSFVTGGNIVTTSPIAIGDKGVATFIFDREIGSFYNAGVSGSGGGASTLLSGLLAYYKMDEASNQDRLDSSGNGLTLLDFNANVGVAAGKIAANAARCTPAPPARLLQPIAPIITGDCTVAFWFNKNSAVIDAFMFNTVDNDLFDNGLDCYATTAGAFVTLDVYNGVDFSEVQVALPGTAVYVFTVVTVSGSTISLSVNNGVAATDATVVPGIGPYFNVVGYFGSGSGAEAVNMDTTLCEMGVWNRVLTAGEQTELFNAGAGKTYPFT